MNVQEKGTNLQLGDHIQTRIQLRITLLPVRDKILIELQIYHAGQLLNPIQQEVPLLDSCLIKSIFRIWSVRL